MSIPPEPIRTPKKRFKLQVRYENQERDDVVYFSSEVQEVAIDKSGTFIARNGNEHFACPSCDVFSFSIVEEQEKE